MRPRQPRASFLRSRGVSDRQWRNVLAIIRTQGTLLDRDYLSANASILRVDALLTRALVEGS